MCLSSMDVEENSFYPCTVSKNTIKILIESIRPATGLTSYFISGFYDIKLYRTLFFYSFHQQHHGTAQLILHLFRRLSLLHRF